MYFTFVDGRAISLLRYCGWREQLIARCLGWEGLSEFEQEGGETAPWPRDDDAWVVGVCCWTRRTGERDIRQLDEPSVRADDDD